MFISEQWQKLHQLQGICPVYSEKSIKDDIRRILDEIEDLSTVHIILHTFGMSFKWSYSLYVDSLHWICVCVCVGGWVGV